MLQLEVQSVFGASRFLQKQTEAPAAVSIVTADEIRRYGWRTIADVLRSVRGFYVTDDRSWAYVGLRGFQRPGDYNTRVLLLLDGRRTNDNLYDQALVQEDFLVDIADIERIEVIRGPSSSLYGSNAFLAVVNVITKGPATDRRDKAAVTLGTLGLAGGRISITRQLRDDAAIHVSTAIQHSGGMASFFTPEFDDGTPGAGIANGLDYADRRNALLELRIKRLDITGGYNHRQRGFPTGAYGVARNDPQSWVSDTHTFGDVNWKGELRSGWAADARAGYDLYEYVGSYPYSVDGASPPAANIDRGRGQWLTGGIQLSRRLQHGHRLSLGAERRQNVEERMKSYYEGQPPMLDISRRSSTTGVYAQDEWRVHPQLLLSGGVRYDRYSRFQSPLTPRGAVIVQPTERTALKLMYGEAFRAPNVFETDYYYQDAYRNNQSLSPERTRTLEALVEHYVGRRARFSASWFGYRISDLIELMHDSDADVQFYANLARAHASGVETEAEFKWPSGLQLRGSYSYTRARNTTSAETLSNSPAHIGQALFSVPLPARLFVGVDVRALGPRLTRDGGTVDAHTVANVTLSRFSDARGLGFAATVSNLMNVRYADPVSSEFAQTSVTQNGRTVRLYLVHSF